MRLSNASGGVSIVPETQRISLPIASNSLEGFVDVSGDDGVLDAADDFSAFYLIAKQDVAGEVAAHDVAWPAPMSSSTTSPSLMPNHLFEGDIPGFDDEVAVRYRGLGRERTGGGAGRFGLCETGGLQVIHEVSNDTRLDER